MFRKVVVKPLDRREELALAALAGLVPLAGLAGFLL